MGINMYLYIMKFKMITILNNNSTKQYNEKKIIQITHNYNM